MYINTLIYIQIRCGIQCMHDLIMFYVDASNEYSYMRYTLRPFPRNRLSPFLINTVNNDI